MRPSEVLLAAADQLAMHGCPDRNNCFTDGSFSLGCAIAAVRLTWADTEPLSYIGLAIAANMDARVGWIETLHAAAVLAEEEGQ